MTDKAFFTRQIKEVWGYAITWLLRYKKLLHINNIYIDNHMMHLPGELQDPACWWWWDTCRCSRDAAHPPWPRWASPAPPAGDSWLLPSLWAAETQKYTKFIKLPSISYTWNFNFTFAFFLTASKRICVLSSSTNNFLPSICLIWTGTLPVHVWHTASIYRGVKFLFFLLTNRILSANRLVWMLNFTISYRYLIIGYCSFELVHCIPLLPRTDILLTLIPTISIILMHELAIILTLSYLHLICWL